MKKSRCSDAAWLGRAMVVVALAGSLTTPAGAASGVAPGIGVDAATLRRALREPLRMLDGSAVTLDALRGEVVVVDFWATWCTPCRRELARLDALNADIARRGGRVVAISVDADAGNVRRFVQRNRLRLPVVHDGPDGLARTLDLDHLPFTMVLDRDGQVAFTTLGASEASLVDLIERTRKLVDGRPMVAEGGTR